MKNLRKIADEIQCSKWLFRAVFDASKDPNDDPYCVFIPKQKFKSHFSKTSEKISYRS